MKPAPSTPWLDPRTLARPARVRVFALPFAGGNSAVYRAWGSALPPDIVVCPVLLPGREARLVEPTPGDLLALASAASAALQPHLDVPFVLFSHSMGAMVAFEIARMVQAVGGPAPVILYASGCSAPHLGVAVAATSHLSDREFIDHVRDLGGTPPEVLASAELLDLVLPTLRADFRACERYAYTAGPPLRCRLVAIGGAADEQVSITAVEAWRAHTQGPFEMRILPGGHFFLQDQLPALVAQLAADLGAVGR